jgi:two-component system, chemotaxis family, chemotaxis protein CheY
MKMDATKKVLLVDDDAAYLFIMKRRISRLGALVEVSTAENGAVALGILEKNALEKELPHIIITDIEMPVMDGITFAKEVARLGLVDFTHTKVILNSHKPSYAFLEWSGRDHTVAFFPKPLTDECLASLLG